MLTLLSIAHMQVDCGWLKDAPDQTSHTPHRQHWRGFLFAKTALISLDNPPAN